MNRVLNVMQFDKKDRKNDNVLLLFKEPEAINGKGNHEFERKFSLFSFLEIVQKNVM
jgi:hypothetical protein